MNERENGYEFIWRIKNFNSNLPEIGNKIIDHKCLVSPNFKFYMCGYTLWYIELYPKSGLNGSFIKCLPICKDYGKDYSVSGQLSILNEFNFVHASKEMKMNCSAVFHCDFSNALEFERAKLPPQKDLILRLTLSFDKRDLEKESESLDLEELSKDLHNLWTNPTLTDLTLSVGQNEIQVHRTILCIRAPKFAEIFGFQDGDCFRSTVKVSDLSFDSLKILIKYLYTGKIDKILDDMLLELYEAAIKYNLDHLKYELHPFETQSTACTKVDVFKNELIWKIINYSELKSPVTRLVDLKSCRFILSLVPFTDNSKLHFKMIYFPESNQIYIRCKVWVLDKDRNSHFALDHLQLFESEKITKPIGVINKEKWEFPSLIQNSDLTSNKEKYLPSGILSLKFEFETTEGERKTEIVEAKSFSSNRVGGMSHLIHLRNDFLDIFKARNRPFVGGDYYDGDCYNDITLVTDKKDIGCHKAVLCARSKVFEKLLRNSSVKTMKIADVDYETILLMVQYIYSGSLSNLATVETARLLIASQKYEIDQLTKSCTSLLVNTLTVQNIWEVLVLADERKNDSLLQLACDRYIRYNKEEIFNSDEWKELVLKNPTLTTKVYSEVCENKNRPREFFTGLRRPRRFWSIPRRGS